jgi:hypothetical protein
MYMHRRLMYSVCTAHLLCMCACTSICESLASNPHRVNLHLAACGTIYDSILVYNNGDGTCEVAAQINGSYVSGPCEVQLFNQTCKSFPSPITVVFRRTNPDKEYSTDLQPGLDSLGIGNARYINQLSIQQDPLSSLPASLAPVFLRSLRQVTLQWQIANPTLQRVPKETMEACSHSNLYFLSCKAEYVQVE